MSIQLDWEVESDSTNLQSVGEDPANKRARRRRRWLLLFSILLILAVAGGVVLFIRYRLETRTAELEALLRDSVSAEIAALRIGSWNAFAEMQRSASEDWLQRQRVAFEEYQNLIAENENVQLTGQILEVELDDPRARVHVQEIIDGVPYTRVWFYWRYTDDANDDGVIDGWQHVPPDPTFWGPPGAANTENVTVSYQGVDEALALSMAERFQTWLTLACEALECGGTVPTVEIDIDPEGLAPIQWGSDFWELHVASPYMDRARSDMPFSSEMRLSAAQMLAERLLLYTGGDFEPSPQSDAAYLREAVLRWLVGRMVMVDTGATVIESLAQNYGVDAVGRLLQALGPDSSIALLSDITGQPLTQSNIDWRDFFTHRLQAEQALITQRDDARYLQLYDTREASVLETAQRRFTQPPPQQIEAVLVQRADPSLGGDPQVIVTASISNGGQPREEPIFFRLVDNVWKRAS